MQIGVYQAKTHFPELLVRVETGEEVTITRHGKAVARLLAVDPKPKPDLQATISELRLFNKGRYAGTPMSELIAGGRH